MAFSDALVFGIITMLCWGIGDFLLKLAVDKFGTLKTQFLQYIFSIAISIILIYALFPIPKFSWTLGLLSLFVPYCFLSIVGFLAYTEALRRGPISLVAPVSSGYPIITAILSVILLKETITSFQWSAIFVVVVGVIIVSFSSLQKKISFPGFPFALIGLFSWGILFTLFKPIVSQMGVILPGLLAGVIGFIGLAIFLIFKKETTIPRIKINRWSALIFSSIILALGFIAFAVGVRVSNPGIITTISSTYPAVIILLSVIFLKEKLHWWQIIGILTILIGIIILGQ